MITILYSRNAAGTFPRLFITGHTPKNQYRQRVNPGAAVLYSFYNTPTFADRMPCYIHASTSRHRPDPPCDRWHRTAGSPVVPCQIEQRPVSGRFPRMPDHGRIMGGFDRFPRLNPIRVRGGAAPSGRPGSTR